MPIRVTKQNAPRTSLAERRDLLRLGRNKLDPFFRQIGHGSRKVPGNQGCLQAPQVRRRGFARRESRDYHWSRFGAGSAQEKRAVRPRR